MEEQKIDFKFKDIAIIAKELSHFPTEKIEGEFKWDIQIEPRVFKDVQLITIFL